MSIQMKIQSKGVLDDPPDFIGGDLFNEAIQCMKDGAFKEAIQKYEKLLDLWLAESVRFDEVYRVYNNFGVCYLQMGKTAEAIFLFELANKIAPDYKDAKNNLERFKAQDLSDIHMEGILKEKYGDHWHEEVLKKLEDREANAWSPEKLKALSTEDILAKLESLGIKTNQEDFVNLAKELKSAEDLEEKFWCDQLQAEGWDEDFSWMAAIELWRRWLPEQPCVEMLDDELGHFEKKLEHSEQNDDEQIHQLRRTMTFFRQALTMEHDGQLVVDRALYERWRRQSYWDLDEFIDDIAFGFAENGFYDEAIEIVDFLYQLTGNLRFLNQKAEYLCESGREEEGLKLFSQTAKDHPDDFHTQYEAGAAFGDYRKPQEAIPYLKRAEELATKEESEAQFEYQLMVAEALLRHYKEEGSTELYREQKKYIKKIKQDIKQQEEKNRQKLEEKIMDSLACQSAVRYHRAWENHQLTNVADAMTEEADDDFFSKKPDFLKAQRNDPCPCGSGKKYKKCCLLQKERE